MFKPWKPLGVALRNGSPGFEISISDRTIKITRSEWINHVCISAMTIEFKHGIVGLYMFDESTDRSAVLSPENTAVFDSSSTDAKGCEAWIEENSPRTALYGELGKLNYNKIDSYYFHGQSVVFLIDTDATPLVTMISPDELPAWA